MSEGGFTPTTEQVRAAYTRAMRNAFVASAGEHDAEFDRWLAEHDRLVAENALQEVGLNICHDPRTDLTNQSHSLSVISAHLALLATAALTNGEAPHE